MGLNGKEVMSLFSEMSHQAVRAHLCVRWMRHGRWRCHTGTTHLSFADTGNALCQLKSSDWVVVPNLWSFRPFCESWTRLCTQSSVSDTVYTINDLRCATTRCCLSNQTSESTFWSQQSVAMAWKTSGISHNGVYDPVTTTSDRVFIRDPEDDGSHWTGRTYVTLRTYHTPALKNFYSKIKSRTSPRCLLIGLIVTLLLLLLVMVIALSSQEKAHADGGHANKPFMYEQWVKKETGMPYQWCSLCAMMFVIYVYTYSGQDCLLKWEERRSCKWLYNPAVQLQLLLLIP